MEFSVWPTGGMKVEGDGETRGMVDDFHRSILKMKKQINYNYKSNKKNIPEAGKSVSIFNAEIEGVHASHRLTCSILQVKEKH